MCRPWSRSRRTGTSFLNVFHPRWGAFPASLNARRLLVRPPRSLVVWCDVCVCVCVRVDLTTSVVATTCAAAALLLAARVPRGHFAHILIDESGQAMEPEILVPLVIAGDHCQLGPAVRSPFALRQGLGVSLQERLMAALADGANCPTALPAEGTSRPTPHRARDPRRSRHPSSDLVTPGMRTASARTTQCA